MSSEQRESTDRPNVKTSSKGQLGWIKLKVSRVIISMDDKNPWLQPVNGFRVDDLKKVTKILFFMLFGAGEWYTTAQYKGSFPPILIT